MEKLFVHDEGCSTSESCAGNDYDSAVVHNDEYGRNYGRRKNTQKYKMTLRRLSTRKGWVQRR